MKKLILLKLGGSLITDKTKPHTVQLNTIKDLAHQIKKALDKDSDIQLVIGNGAGSYGHYPAEKYKMMEGITNEKQKMGFCIVQDAVGQLNRIIVKELLRAGVKAISIHPSSIIIAKNKKIRTFFLDPVLNLLSLGIVPVLYGDIVYDSIVGSTIFSTEQILGEIAQRFLKQGIHVVQFIHNGVTKGVLDAQGKVIPLIRTHRMSQLKKIFYATAGYDVTGGMFHKVQEAMKLARLGIQTLIINGNNDHDILYKALVGQKVEGTLIR